MKGSFFNLTPEIVLTITEDAGFQPTGQFVQLNSYENRVFDIQLEDRENIIAKFYRPGRWSKASIKEEHQFLFDLNAADINCLLPLKIGNTTTSRADKTSDVGKTEKVDNSNNSNNSNKNCESSILDSHGLFVSFFPKFKGRMPQELFEEDFKKIGRLLAQVHNVGAKKQATHRPIFDSSYYGGWETLSFLRDWVSPEVHERYFDAAENILHFVDSEFDSSDFIRIHGDCHKGNLLQQRSYVNESMYDTYYLVDFDDFCNGPAVQDLWMLLSFEDSSMQQEMDLITEGYETFREFPYHQWSWVDALRGLRIIMYAGWIAKRWTDPSFPKIFTEFGTFTYWAEEVEALEKISWKL